MFKKCLLCLALLLSACGDAETAAEKELPKVQIILDWLPNANHTGIFVAKEMGFFEGIDVQILPTGSESASDLVITGRVPFGVYFQDYLAPKIARGAPVSAVAAIVQPNTSGFIAKSADFKQLSGAVYGSYGYAIELAMLDEIFAKQGLKAPKIVPNDGYSAAVSIASGMFDFANAFYGYDAIAAEQKGLGEHFYFYKDFGEEFNFYSPVILANNAYLQGHKSQADAFLRGLCKGYKYAAAHPQEAAQVLIKYAKTPESERDYVIKSQEYLSSVYLDEQGEWGRIDAARWNRFYDFLNAKIDAGAIKMPKLAPNAGLAGDFAGCK